MMAIGWKLVGDGKPLPLGAVVRPDERLSWPKTIGVGAQHVVAMFGATFVFPLIMGLDPNLAIMMSGVCTILFLLVVANKIPSYLGTSASFVGAVVAIRASGGSSASVTASHWRSAKWSGPTNGCPGRRRSASAPSTWSPCSAPRSSSR